MERFLFLQKYNSNNNNNKQNEFYLYKQWIQVFFSKKQKVSSHIEDDEEEDLEWVFKAKEEEEEELDSSGVLCEAQITRSSGGSSPKNFESFILRLFVEWESKEWCEVGSETTAIILEV